MNAIASEGPDIPKSSVRDCFMLVVYEHELQCTAGQRREEELHGVGTEKNIDQHGKPKERPPNKFYTSFANWKGWYYKKTKGNTLME